MSVISAQRLIGPLAFSDVTYSMSQDVKESTYKGLVRPVLEYGSSVWDPPSILLQDELEKVQKRQLDLLLATTSMKLGV